jgi:hypothetical protein
MKKGSNKTAIKKKAVVVEQSEPLSDWVLERIAQMK